MILAKHKAHIKSHSHIITTPKNKIKPAISKY